MKDFAKLVLTLLGIFLSVALIGFAASVIGYMAGCHGEADYDKTGWEM